MDSNHHPPFKPLCIANYDVLGDETKEEQLIPPIYLSMMSHLIRLIHGTVYTFRLRVSDGQRWTCWSEYSPPIQARENTLRKVWEIRHV